MKKFLLPVLGMLVLTLSCKNKKTGDRESKISPRDYSITPANAYNNIFLDSSAVVAFLVKDSIDLDLSDKIRSFYNLRNYEFAWFDNQGITEQARSFWNLLSTKNDSALTNKKLKREMQEFWADDHSGVSAADKSVVQTELWLTEAFMRYMQENYDQGAVKKKDLERFIPRKKEDLMKLADSFAAKRNTNSAYEEANDAYKQLREELVKYLAIAKNGGWPMVTPPGKKPYKRNSTDPAIPSIKKRLATSGHFVPGDTTAIFDVALESAVKNYEISMGFIPDGLVTKELVAEMNVPVQKRIAQLLINMDRMRWLPEAEKGNQLIVTNIPDFKLHMYEGDKEAFNMNVVVGKEGHNTVIFTGKLSQVVFSPYWNVPVSIVKNEIMPKLASNSNYLEQQNMEVVSQGNGLPDIRQRPGGQNALGKVKFLFPNDFNIYFHDTPSKSLFKAEQRAFSHGCIRLSNPVKMANYLLKDESEWNAQNINAAMNAGTEKFVQLKEPIPVLITYYTAWVDDAHKLHFRNDVYGHDELVSKKMFTNY